MSRGRLELFLFVRGELVFSDAAERTLEIIGKIFELGSGLDSGLEIAVLFVIDVSADVTYKFCHGISSIKIKLIIVGFFYEAMIKYIFYMYINKSAKLCQRIFLLFRDTFSFFERSFKYFMKSDNFTQGNIVRGMLRFSVPYLITCFLQTFYGMADLFIVGQFNEAASITAVSVGSQLMHMLTVVIAGFAMGSTVLIGRSVGAGNRKRIAAAVSTTFAVFALLAAALTILLFACTNPIIGVLQVPAEAVPEATAYMRICFAGVIFITAYNVVSAVFRGLGDTRRPMYYVAVAGVINVGLDWLLVGPMGMGAGGAAIATVASQGISVLLGMVSLKKYHSDAFPKSLQPNGEDAGNILRIGVPIALQEGLIQVSFLVITMIANSRGVEVSAAVGIVEKVISFLFLVPSAMLSTVSALCAQNAGAGQHDRSRQVLRIGCMICAGFGAIIFLLCQPLAPWIVSLFVKNGDNVETVVRLGGQYLRTYSVDCMLAGIHFCFSGFFSAYGKSVYSFIHNIISIITFRIPGAWIAAVYFPATLYPMGLAAPLGSLLSVFICLFLYRRMKLNA